MQPITQATLDPMLDDIRHLRAEQRFDEAIGRFGLFSPPPRFKTSRNRVSEYVPDIWESLQSSHSDFGLQLDAITPSYRNYLMNSSTST